MTTFNTFASALLADPYDAVTAAVFADWLEESGHSRDSLLHLYASDRLDWTVTVGLAMGARVPALREMALAAFPEAIAEGIERERHGWYNVPRNDLPSFRFNKDQLRRFVDCLCRGGGWTHNMDEAARDVHRRCRAARRAFLRAARGPQLPEKDEPPACVKQLPRWADLPNDSVQRWRWAPDMVFPDASPQPATRGSFRRRLIVCPCRNKARYVALDSTMLDYDPAFVEVLSDPWVEMFRSGDQITRVTTRFWSGRCEACGTVWWRQGETTCSQHSHAMNFPEV